MKPLISSTKIFFFSLCVLLLACKKGDSGDDNNNATYYYKATIGGVNYFQDVTETNDYIAGSGSAGTDDVSLSASINPISSPAPNSTTLEITKGIMHNYFSSTIPQFKAFFTPGNYPYTTGPEFDPFQNGNGIYIMWLDKQGNLWTTIDGSGDQTGSNFKIISATDDADPLTYYIRVKMQFNCKLYKEGTGEMIQLTNGEMVGLFGKI
jgi:hypothetical protein